MSDSADIEKPSARLSTISNVLANVVLAISCGVPAFVIWAFFNFLGAVSDFPEYYAAAKMTLSGNAAGVYDLVQLGTAQHSLFNGMKERIVGFYWPPPGLFFVLPFGLLAAIPAAVVWMSLQIVAICISFILLRKMFPGNKQYYMLVITYAFLSGPLYEALRLGQPAAILLAAQLIALYLWQQKKPFAGALALVVFAAKPQLLLPILLMLLASRQLKMIGIAIALLSSIFIAALILFGPQTFQSYLHGLSEGMKLGPTAIAGAMAAELNPTVRGQLMRFAFIPKQVVSTLSLLTIGTGAIISFLLMNKLRNHKNAFELSLLVALPLGLVCSLHCHDYDLLLLTPAVLAIDRLDHGGSRFWNLLLISRLLFLLAFLLPVFISLHYKYLLEAQITINPLFFALAFFALSAIFCAFQIAAKSDE